MWPRDITFAMKSKATSYTHISNNTTFFLVQLPECLQYSSVCIEKHTNTLQSTSPITHHFHTKYYIQKTKHIPGPLELQWQNLTGTSIIHKHILAVPWHVVSCWPLILEVNIWTQASPCEIYGEQSGTRTGSSLTIQ